jgi:hypothetical protein
MTPPALETKDQVRVIVEAIHVPLIEEQTCCGLLATVLNREAVG